MPLEKGVNNKKQLHSIIISVTSDNEKKGGTGSSWGISHRQGSFKDEDLHKLHL